MADDTAVRWPEWLTPEYSALHTAIINDMVRALEHCYVSADAAGMDWTQDGFYSCAASNILGRMKRAGCPPTFGETEELSFQDVHDRWSGGPDDDWEEDEDPDDRPLSADDLRVLAQFARDEGEQHDGPSAGYWQRLASRAHNAALRLDVTGG